MIYLSQVLCHAHAINDRCFKIVSSPWQQNRNIIFIFIKKERILSEVKRVEECGILKIICKRATGQKTRHANDIYVVDDGYYDTCK